MKRWAVTVLVLAEALAATATAAAPPPVLTLAGRQPLVVAGTHFHPRESVRVTVSSRARRSVVVRSSPAGTFRLQLDDVTLGHCGGLQIRAAGTLGSVALLKLPLPACSPARQP